VVSDKEAVIACRRFLDDQRLLVEPACGAALSLLYERHAVLEPYHRLLLIVCGGATATLEQIEAWGRQLTK
jgi:L-serine/L-threonine ammonia-lyase